MAKRIAAAIGASSEVHLNAFAPSGSIAKNIHWIFSLRSALIGAIANSIKNSIFDASNKTV